MKLTHIIIAAFTLELVIFLFFITEMFYIPDFFDSFKDSVAAKTFENAEDYFTKDAKVVLSGIEGKAETSFDLSTDSSKFKECINSKETPKIEIMTLLSNKDYHMFTVKIGAGTSLYENDSIDELTSVFKLRRTGLFHFKIYNWTMIE